MRNVGSTKIGEKKVMIIHHYLLSLTYRQYLKILQTHNA